MLDGRAWPARGQMPRADPTHVGKVCLNVQGASQAGPGIAPQTQCLEVLPKVKRRMRTLTEDDGLISRSRVYSRLN